MAAVTRRKNATPAVPTAVWRWIRGRFTGDNWWVPVAAGIIVLAASMAALTALGAQLKMMHLPGVAGAGAQGYSTSHLADAVRVWCDFWDCGEPTSDVQALGLASPLSVAKAWFWIDLLLFIPAYAIAGSIALRRATARSPAWVVRSAPVALLLGALFDLGETLFSLLSVEDLWNDQAAPLAPAIFWLTLLKTIFLGCAILVLLLLLAAWWAGRKDAAREAPRLLRAQIGIAILTVVVFLLPVQLPDIFLSLNLVKAVSLLATGTLLAVSTWATARWIVVRREEDPWDPEPQAVPMPIVVVPLLVAGGLALVNCATGGGWVGPIVPVGLAIVVFLGGRPFPEGSKAKPEQKLGRTGVMIPHALSVVGLTLAGVAAIKAEATRAVGADDLGRLWALQIAVVLFIAVVGRLIYLLDYLIAGKRVRTMSPKPALRLVQPGGGASNRFRRLGMVVGLASVTVVGSTWRLLAFRVEDLQVVGAGAAVFLFLAGITLLVGTTILVSDAWVCRYGVPRLFGAMGAKTIPVLSLFLVWGLVAAAADDGRHWDVRKLEATKVKGTTFEQEFDRWAMSARLRKTVEAGRKPIPMVFVAASGGGIRAAYWTALAADCVFSGSVASGWNGSDPCKPAGAPAPVPEDVFLASGISGGSLGLVEWDASREPDLGSGWVADKLGGDFVAPTVAWGLMIEVPRSFLHFAADDRAEVLEESWEAPWGSGDDNPMRTGFLQRQSRTRGPLLMLNGSSVADGCVLNVSLFDEGTRHEDDLPLVDCTISQPGGEVPRGEPEGELPMTADVIDYLRCDTEHDIRRSTAALLSARFPYVSSAGRLTACTAKESTKFIVDGGYLDTSAAEPAVAAYLAVEPLIERYNALSPRHCIVPYFVQIDNGYLDPASPPSDAKPPNQLVAPLQALLASTGLQSRAERARTLAAELFTRDFATAPGDVTGVRERYALIAPHRHPGVEAPLGWTLSAASQADLRGQLYGGNQSEIQNVQEWFSKPPTCGDLPKTGDAR